MAKEKSASITRSANGPATADVPGQTTEQSTQNELERLRDILVGNHVRRSEQRVAELQAQLEATQHALEQRLDELAADLGERMLETRAETRRQDDALRHELQEMKRLLAAEKGLRASVGQMLVEVGRLLQQDELPAG